MTYYEKIKSMSIEELAKYMCDTFDCNCCPCAEVDDLFFEANCPVNPDDGWKLLVKLLDSEADVI